MNNDVSVPVSIVKIDEDDLLPCSQCQSPSDEWNGEGRFHEGSPYMREPVAVTPAPVMLIGDIGRSKFFDGFLQITEYTRFVLYGCDSSRRSRTENRYQTLFYSRPL